MAEYAASKGCPEFNAQRFVDYYAEADWHDSKGNPVRNWKQKLLAVWLKPADKQPSIEEITGCHACTEEEAIEALRAAGLWEGQTP